MRENKNVWLWAFQALQLTDMFTRLILIAHLGNKSICIECVWSTLHIVSSRIEPFFSLISIDSEEPRDPDWDVDVDVLVVLHAGAVIIVIITLTPCRVGKKYDKKILPRDYFELLSELVSNEWWWCNIIPCYVWGQKTPLFNIF